MLILFILLEIVFLTELFFNSDGTFKILQVADTHYENGAKSPCVDVEPSEYPCSGINTTQFVEKIVELEKPDFIVYTGDNIDWNCPESEPCMDEVFKPAYGNKVYWAGDGQSQGGKYGRENVIKYMSKIPYSLTQNGPIDVHGFGNFKIPIYKRNQNGEKEVKFELFFFDSGENQDSDWIHRSQQDWYQKQSSDIPTIGFFHIPLQETEEIMYLKIPYVGDHFDTRGWSKINPGAFYSFYEKKNMKAMFNGHDHTDDYCASLLDIYICFGGGVTYNVYGKKGWPRRLRILEFHQFGEKFYTWKRLDDENVTKKDLQMLWNSTI